jgi:glycosyltransferase involved in cell wall biosynthesis
MIKVLHFFKTYYPETMGGIEQVIFQIAEGGARHGFESEVLSLSRQGAARDEVVGHHVSHRSKLDFQLASTGFSLSVFKDFAELAKKADVIHYHFPWPLMDLVHFASRVHKPTVVSYHSDIIKQKTLLKLYQPLMGRFLSSVDRIVASSPNYVQSSPVLNRFKSKVRVIPYGLDRGTYPESSAEKLNYWRGLVGNRFFLFVGALRYYKGLDYLLAAAQTTQLPVVILGGGHLEEELKAQALQLGLTNVYFVGSLPDDDKAALLELCYAFIFPSHLRSESFGISLLEGAMFGKPMISCEIGTGTTFINIAGETGLVVPPCDSGALGQAMVSLWQNPEMASTMGKNALRRYEAIFSADVMTESYAKLYKELLQ